MKRTINCTRGFYTKKVMKLAKVFQAKMHRNMVDFQAKVFQYSNLVDFVETLHLRSFGKYFKINSLLLFSCIQSTFLATFSSFIFISFNRNLLYILAESVVIF